MADELREKLGVLAGHASMCWNPRPKGVFDSTEAGKAVDDAYSAINKHMVSREEYESIYNSNTSNVKSITDLCKQINVLQAEIKALKANHKDMVERNAALRQRPDLDVSRLPVVIGLQAELKALKERKVRYCTSQRDCEHLSVLNKNVVSVEDIRKLVWKHRIDSDTGMTCAQAIYQLINGGK